MQDPPFLPSKALLIASTFQPYFYLFFSLLLNFAQGYPFLND